MAGWTRKRLLLTCSPRALDAHMGIMLRYKIGLNWPRLTAVP